MEFLYAVVESFKSLRDREVIRFCILNGIIWAAVWISLAFVLWEEVFNITAFLINLLPFKFVQNAGAEFIFMILWLQAVLISIGVFFSLFNSLLNKKLISIVVALFFAIFWFVVFIYFKNEILNYLEKLIRIFPFESIEQAVAVVLAVFVFYSFYILSIFLGFIFISEKRVITLLKEEYPYIEISSTLPKIKIAFVLVKDFLIFILALIFLYPLMFLPVINVFIIVGLWAYIVKNALYETVKALIGNDNINIGSKLLWGFSVLSVFLNFIPVVNLFAPAIGVFSIAHYIMEKKTDMLENS